MPTPVHSLTQNPKTRQTLVWNIDTRSLALRSPASSGAPELTDDEAIAEVLRDPDWTTAAPDSTVAWLVDRWCDRRAFEALRHILVAWPNHGLTDGYAQLADALGRVRGLARGDLKAVEEELVGIAESAIRTMLRRAR